ncbi:MAG TPA: hypothetical protein VF145_08890 [Chitinophagaceae bacterium]
MQLAKLSLVSSIALIVYGYICRMFDIFFFWESLYAGYILLLASISVLLILQAKRSSTARRRIFSYSASAVFALPMLWILLLLFLFPKTEAFRNAVTSLRMEAEIVSDIGEVGDISVVPAGYVQWAQHDQPGLKSEFQVILKGRKAYREVKVELTKDPTGQWTVTKWK